ncbi:MAG: hypothetical protein ACOX83_07145 [Candidatus Spyradocola sp.]|jgi:hypothetical protein
MARTIVQYSGFFDSIGATPSDAGDIREYPAREFSIHVKELFTDGVKRDQLKVVPSDTPYTVGVELGFACVQGRYYNMVLEGVSDGDDPQYLPLEFEAAATRTRVDRVVLRLDDSATLLGRWIRPMILAGTEGSDEPPALTRNDTVYEISLAQIKVRPGANAVAAEDITDERADASVCGWCKPYGATTPGMISAENVETAGAYPNAQAYLEGLEGTKANKSSAVTASLPVSGWSGESAPYTQTVQVAGVTAGTNALLDYAHGQDADTEKALAKAWSCITEFAAGPGTITATCLASKPGADLTLRIILLG